MSDAYGKASPAYLPWELRSFDPVEPAAEVSFPSVSDLDALYLNAKTEGYDAGHAEGMQRAEAEMARLRGLLARMEEDLQFIETGVAEDILSLSLEVARQMVRQIVHVQPQHILPVIQEAITVLPSLGQGLRIFLHPDDIALVRSHLDDNPPQERWRIVPDVHLEHGGCRIESGGAEADASLTERWKRVVARLGRSQAWLQPDIVPLPQTSSEDEGALERPA